MKKIILMFCPLIIIVFAFIFSDFSLKEFFNGNNSVALSSIDFGFVTEVQETENYKKYVKDNQIVGECFLLKLSKNKLNELITSMGLMITNKYYVNNTAMIEGVCAKSKFKIENRQANVQIAVSGDKVTIGFPIIYGSY